MPGLQSIILDESKSREQVAEAHLMDILTFFHLGELGSFSRVKEGKTNLTYLVTTVDECSYIVRILQRHDREALENEYKVSSVLTFGGIFAPRMILSPRGDYLYRNEGLWATVSVKLAGGHIAGKASPSQMVRIGSTLAQFHKVLQGVDLPHKNSNNLLNPLEIEARLSRIEVGSYRSKIDELILSSTIQHNDTLPSGVLHGDFHVNNILIDDLDVVVLDLQNLHRGPFVMDIGRSLADICSDDNKLDYELVSAFIRGYEQYRKLQPVEQELINRAIAYSAAAISAWFYERGDQRFANRFLNVSLTASAQ